MTEILAPDLAIHTTGVLIAADVGGVRSAGNQPHQRPSRHCRYFRVGVVASRLESHGC